MEQSDTFYNDQGHSRGRSMSMSRSRSRSSRSPEYRRRASYSRSPSSDDSVSPRRGRKRYSSNMSSRLFSRSWSQGRRRSSSMHSKSRRRSLTRSPSMHRDHGVLVSNLSKVVHVGHIREIFFCYGYIVDINIDRNRDSCKVFFETEGQAKECCYCMDGGIIDYKTIKVRPIRQKMPYSNNSRYRRRSYYKGQSRYNNNREIFKRRGSSYDGKYQDQRSSRYRSRSITPDQRRSASPRRRSPSYSRGRRVSRGRYRERESDQDRSLTRYQTWSRSRSRRRSESLRRSNSRSTDRLYELDRRPDHHSADKNKDIEMNY